MKIFLPFVDLNDNEIDDPQVTGGAELFCRHIHDHFETKVHQLPIKSLKYPLKERNIISRDILEKAGEYGADIIVSNFSGSIFSGAQLVKSNIPIMIIDHVTYPMLSIIGRWDKARKNGHSVFFVSRAQENKYRMMAKRCGQVLPRAKEFINPSFCMGEKPKIQDIEYDCATIGRCYRGKDPFKLHRFLKKSDLNGLVITSKTEYDPEPYYEKNKHWDNTMWNKPHDESMVALGKSRTYFSTCDYETWGIGSLEALSHGIPIILSCDKTGIHASENIPASKRHCKTIDKKDKEGLISAITSFKSDRKEIQDMTWEKHNLQAWKSHLTKCFSMTVDNHKKVTMGISGA